ncbi:hypothetical protein UA08_04452 [Talaromyces atroroseus]|uniref:Uncharacterized protein n=1 Tax=Talaromyces atroroseus TaxID=1441469 RepID=A0A1Q5Q8N7_TALAT|nr:hypothetical protein UA08_04452 [Talaromyces atroroseus]OKL60320.1 hypothetical protein UA08_04452 [Talaromyces atroroseus]
MQTTVDDEQTVGAHKFLVFVERNRHSLHLLDRDRAYLIAQLDQMSANQLSWPKSAADVSDMFVFMLQAQWISAQYHGRHPDSDFADKELWRIRENRGVNSQGKLREYAKERNMDYNRLRDTVQVNQKAGAIEAELGVPGLGKTLYSAFKRLRDLKQNEIESFCRLFRASDSFADYKSYAAIALALLDDYLTLMQRHDLDQ